MTEARNPYAPPTAHVADQTLQPAAGGEDKLIPNGRRVPFGNGSRWLGDAWRLFRGRPGKWILATVIFVVLLVAASVIPYVDLVSGLLGPLVAGGLVYAADRQRRTGTFEFDDLFNGFTANVRPLLVVGCVILLILPIFYVSLAMWVGTDAANAVVLHHGEVEPGLGLSKYYWLALLTYLALAVPIFAATYLAAPLITLKQVPAGEAMKMSLLGTLKNILPGLLFSILVTLFVIGSMIPLGLGLLVSLPVLMITPYTMYRDIFLEQS